MSTLMVMQHTTLRRWIQSVENHNEAGHGQHIHREKLILEYYDRSRRMVRRTPNVTTLKVQEVSSMLSLKSFARLFFPPSVSQPDRENSNVLPVSACVASALEDLSCSRVDRESCKRRPALGLN